MAHSIPKVARLRSARLSARSFIRRLENRCAPGIGKQTDAKRLAAIGAEGVLALISDSTNILREGMSPSEPMSP